MKEKPKYKIGDEITLKGKIECGHDFSFRLIDFKDQGKKFVVENILTHEAPNWRYKLTADGYGDLRGFYGSGSIYVYEKNLKGGEEMKDEKKKEPTRKDMLACFEGMCAILAVHGFTERDERAVAIRKLLKEE